MPSQPADKMQLLVDLCPYWCNPPGGGGPMRVHHLNKALSEFRPVYQLSFRPTLSRRMGTVLEWLSLRPDRITRRYTERRILDPITLATSYALYKARLPHDLLLSLTASMAAPTPLVGKVLRSWRGRIIIQVEHPWLFRYGKSLSRRLRAPVVFVAHNVESSLVKSLNRQPGSLARLVEKRVEELEQEAWTQADAVVTVSEADRLVLDRYAPRDPSTVSLIPNGVDVSLIKPVRESEKRLARQLLGLPQDSPLLLFIGSDHSPNREAVRLLAQMANLTAFPQNARFVIVGTVSRYIKPSRRIIVRGFVEDVRPYLTAADVAVNPLLSGAGTSVKTVEYMASGLPVVSTEVGVRGLPVSDGVHAIVRPPNEILAAVETVLQDPQLGYLLGTNARKLVEQHYSWAVLATDMAGVYERLGRGW